MACPTSNISDFSTAESENLFSLSHGWGGFYSEDENWRSQCVGNLHTLCDRCRPLEDWLSKHPMLDSDKEINLDIPDHHVYLGTVSEALANGSVCYCCRALSWLATEFDGSGGIYGQLKASGALDLALTIETSQPDDTAIVLRPLTAKFGKESRILPYNPQRLDLTRIRNWIDCCGETHAEHCENDHKLPLESGNLGFVPLEEIILIDLEKDCVVTASFETRYVALSYVWGSSLSVLASKENLKALQQPGSLSEENKQFILPRTIRDAMKLCLLLGETKLWVDSLCIIQDEGELKQRFLNAMASIYANAHFTIVAASGTNADHGILGITTDRNTPCIIVDFPHTPMMVQSEHLTSAYPHLSRWATRGWTFQESVFSKRLLIMDKLVSWVCGKTSFLEECEDLKSRRVLYGDTSKETCSFHKSVAAHANPAGWGKLVALFNRRELTYQGDLLNAFAGITTVMAGSLPGGIHHGIVVEWFEIGMLWDTHGWIRRRVVVDEKNGKALPLPSWSWLSFSGRLNLEVWEDAWKGIKIPEDAKVKVFPVVEWQMFEPANSNAANKIVDKNGEKPILFVEHIRQNSNRLPASTHLHFRTERARVSLWSKFEYWTEILDKKNRSIGILVAAPHTSSADGETWRTAELIAISHGRIRGGLLKGGTWCVEEWYENIGLETENVDWFDFVNVLCVRWEDGVTYRRALGRVVKSAWENLDLDVIDVVLG